MVRSLFRGTLPYGARSEDASAPSHCRLPTGPRDLSVQNAFVVLPRSQVFGSQPLTTSKSCLKQTQQHWRSSGENTRLELAFSLRRSPEPTGPYPPAKSRRVYCSFAHPQYSKTGAFLLRQASLPHCTRSLAEVLLPLSGGSLRSCCTLLVSGSLKAGASAKYRASKALRDPLGVIHNMM